MRNHTRETDDDEEKKGGGLSAEVAEAEVRGRRCGWLVAVAGASMSVSVPVAMRARVLVRPRMDTCVAGRVGGGADAAAAREEDEENSEAAMRDESDDDWQTWIRRHDEYAQP